MAFILLVGAVILIVTAIRNTYRQLGTALGQDVPGFTVWLAAIFGVALIGFIPKLSSVSRGLMTLVLLVLFMTNYRNILAGFASMWQSPPSPANSGGSSSSSAGTSSGIFGGLLGGNSSSNSGDPYGLNNYTSGLALGALSDQGMGSEDDDADIVVHTN